MLQGVFEILLEVVSGFTGEVILWVVTLGRRKPFEPKNNWIASSLIGLIFWLMVIVAVVMIFR
jgi:hypothetical protein